MRKIKFRAWDKENEKMMKVSSLHLENKEISVKENGTFHLFRMQDLMQYTGLRDKNNKEIYEGDIVILNDAEEENKCIVKYKYGSYILVDGDLRENLSNVEDRFLEVIGNIYENKSLLEENKWVNTR